MLDRNVAELSIDQLLENADPKEIIEFYTNLLASTNCLLDILHNSYQELVDAYMNGDNKAVIRFDFDMESGTCKEAEISFAENKSVGGKLWIPGH